MQSRGRLNNRRNRLPFWLPAPNFYILTAVLTLIFCCTVWAVSRDGGDEDENSIIIACAGAGLTIGSAVFLREVILRKARNRYLAIEKQLDFNMAKAARQNGSSLVNKVSLAQNAAILKEINRKSEAAKVLGKLPEVHREVFEICGEYLSMSAYELKTVGAGSPRLAAFRRGRKIVKGLHRFHLLEWVEAETKKLTREAKIRVTISEKLNAVEKALNLINSAMQFYPNELQLTDSEIALKEFISSIKVSHWMEQAEKAAFKGDFQKAVSFYRDALYFLGRENIRSVEREIVAEKINREIEKLRRLENKSKKTFSASPDKLE